MTARRFCFTIFDVDHFYQFFDPATADLRFIVFQTEVSPTTGARHVQGYIELNGPQRMTGVKRILGEQGAHVERAQGSADQNIEYCTKEESRELGSEPTIFGERPAQGQRSDLITFVDSVKAGYSDRQILDDHPKEFVKYNRCMLAVRTAMAAPRNSKPHVSVYWGPTGTGKSARAHLKLPNAYKKMPENKWWCGYTTGQSVIIDDFVDTQMNIAYLLQLLDRYAFKVEVSVSVSEVTEGNTEPP